MVAVEIIICYYLSNLCALLLVIVVELLIFMCINKLLTGTGNPPGMIYPAGYGSGGNSPPIVGMGILAVSNFYGGYGSGVAIPDGDLPIAILICNKWEINPEYENILS